MKKVKRLRLFRAYISYIYDNNKRVYLLENCINVKGRVAQIYKWRVRPIFINLNAKQREFLIQELRKSNGSINAHNYETFLPYMAKLSHDYNTLVVDLDSSHGINMMNIHLRNAKRI